MGNIFENAYFGKAYKTRDNRKFIYLGEIKSLFGNHSAIQGMIENDYLMYYYNKDGKSLYCEFSGSAINASNVDFEQVFCEEEHNDDIISEWQEPISEEEIGIKFNEFSNSTEFRSLDTPYFYFSAGYLKAMEEM